MTMPAPEVQPPAKPERKRKKIEPPSEGTLEALLIEESRAKDAKADAEARETEISTRIRTLLLELREAMPEDQRPEVFEIPADHLGRYPAYTLSLKIGHHLDAGALLHDAPLVHARYWVESKPSWELRAVQQRRRT